MTTYQVGDTIAWGITVTDPTGTPANPGTGPTATVTLPDGTTSAATVTTSGTGLWAAALLSTQVGRHRIVWTASGANSADFPHTDVCDVWPLDPRYIISLADARAALNPPATAVTNDDEIRLYVAAATALIESRIGPVLTRTTVETRSGSGAMALPLYDQPTAITSVVEDGVTLAATDYCWDEAGLLWRGSRPGAGVWSRYGVRNVVVTYTVGGPVIVPEVVLAAREAVKVMYQRSQQASRPMFGSADGYDGGGFVPVGWGMVETHLAAAENNKMPGFA